MHSVHHLASSLTKFLTNWYAKNKKLLDPYVCSVMSDSQRPHGLYHQAPLSMEFFSKNHFLLQEIFLTQGLNPLGSPVLAGGFFTTSATWQALLFLQFSCSVLSDSLWPMNCSMPGLPVHHQLSESTQSHVHWVGDAIQPSHPLLSLSPPALSLSQHQGPFKWVSSPHQVAKVLEL